MLDKEFEIPKSRMTLTEALDLSSEILKDIELGRTSLSSSALKACRLARLLNDEVYYQVFQYEVSGYPFPPGGFTSDVWELLKIANRIIWTGDHKSQQQMGYAPSIESLQSDYEVKKLALGAAQDADFSVSSANPQQYVFPRIGNTFERSQLQTLLTDLSRKIAARRAFVHSYVLRRHYELKYSEIAVDVFSRLRESADVRLAELLPEALQKFSAVHDNLDSDNPEKWSNAVHSCRRILQDVADRVFFATKDIRTKPDGRRIELGAEQYINRLICYAEDKSKSARFQELVGSHLHFLGDRLDAVFRATQKGSHANVTKDEAERYVIYTYMLVADILGLDN